MLHRDAENNLFARGYPSVAGIDEAGRGPLAGPVVAAVVMINKGEGQAPADAHLQDIKDSKKLTPSKREKAFSFIKDNFVTTIGMCDNKTIDRINIREATFLAIKKALGEMNEKPGFLLIDGTASLPNCSYQQQCIKNGDSSVFSIAAASIVAKVTRDRIMEDLHHQYPSYGFNSHKGYGTRSHLENIKKHGPCPIHRTSFKPVADNLSRTGI